MDGQNLFITFEGMDGCGKTTQCSRLLDQLKALAIPAIATCEPSGTKFGEHIRALMTASRDNIPLPAFAEALLVYAARYDHVRSVVRPALEAGSWVLCDRFMDSTFAYQFFETGLDKKLFEHLNEVAIGRTVPDRTYIFDVDPEIARTRRVARRQDNDSAEATRDYYRIRRGFQKVCADDNARCVLIDSSLDEATISAIILNDIGAIAPLPKRATDIS